jgi:hypothetical protein
MADLGDRVATIQRRLAKAARKHWTYRLDALGTVGDYPFLRLSIPHRGRHMFSLCLSSGIHGDEPAGVEALLRLIEDQPFPSGVSVDCFPCMNPEGFQTGQREDGRGRDLNRLFGTDSPPESVRLFQNVVHYRHYDFFLELHEDSGAEGFYAFEMPGCHGPMGPGLIKGMRGRGCLIERPETLRPLLESDGLLSTQADISDGLVTGAPEAAPVPFAQAVYMRKAHADHAMTFETPTRQTFESRVETHLDALHHLLGHMRAQGLFWDSAHEFHASEPHR